MAPTRTHTTIEEIKSISENMSKLDMQEWIHRQANELLMVKIISMDDIEENKKLKEENKKLKEENEQLKKEKFKQQKISNVKTDLIQNLFSKMVQNADIDDGLSISKEYGNKYIDEWNGIYHDIIKQTIDTINKCELDDDQVYLQFHDCNNIEFCMKESEEEESDEESDEEESEEEESDEKSDDY
jgi:hypothetical protein